jgi:hypothetical protein
VSKSSGHQSGFASNLTYVRRVEEVLMIPTTFFSYLKWVVYAFLVNSSFFMVVLWSSFIVLTVIVF